MKEVDLSGEIIIRIFIILYTLSNSSHGCNGLKITRVSKHAAAQYNS